MSRNPDDLLQQAIAAARAGQRDEARSLLVQVLKANPQSEQGWIWMSATVETKAERIHCLKQVLAINPENELALKGLRALDAWEAPLPPEPVPAAEPEIESEPESITEPEPEEVFQEIPERPEPPVSEEPIDELIDGPLDEFIVPEELEPEPLASLPELPQTRREKLPPMPAPPAPGGIPLVHGHIVSRAHRAVDEVLNAVRQEQQPVDLGIQWKQPEKLRTTRRRGGIDLRPSPLMLAIAAAVLLVIAIVFITTRLIDNMREDRRQANITPSAVPSITPTLFPTTTPRPTRTPTPGSNQPIFEPTLRAPDARRGEVRFGITATPPYVATGHPASPRMNDAIVAYHEGRYQESLEFIQAARTVDNPVDSYYYEAMSLIKLDRFSDAQAAVTVGLQVEEAFAPLHYAQGLIYLDDGAESRAQRSLERAIEIDPEFLDPRLMLTDIYLGRGETDVALETALAAREIKQYDVNTLIVVSRAYLAGGDLENAAAFANLAAYIDPGSARAVAAQARGRLSLGYFELAAIGLENYQEQVGEGDAEVWALLGEAYGKLGRSNDAQTAYARAIQLSGDVTDALVARGLFYVADGRYELGLADLQQAVENGANTPEIQLGLGEAAYQLGNYDTAQQTANKVLAGDPGNIPAILLAARAATEADDDPEAIVETTANALNTQPALTLEQQGMLYEAQARALYQLERYFEAQVAMEQALFVAETGTRHYYNALILAEIGRVDEAILELEWVKALDQSFDYPFSADLDTVLDELYQQRVDNP